MASETPLLGRLMLDIDGQMLTEDDKELLAHPAVGGLILFSRNYGSPEQVQALVQSVRAINSNMLIAVDQEGGRVQRFKEQFTLLPPLSLIGQRYSSDPDGAIDLARECGWLMAAELLRVGLDFSFAPVLDLYSAASQIIADRAFAADVDSVVTLAHAYIDGMHEAGMIATGKHYPGHGNVVADSHLELPEDTRAGEEILSKDFKVFERCTDVLDAVMPAHVVYSNLDSQCAGFSTYWLQEKLRQELTFDGIIFSDDLTMTAAHSVGGVSARMAKAVAAGCDMMLVCNDRAAALEARDWLVAQGCEQSSRLHRLRANPAEDIQELFAQPRWQAAEQAIAELMNH